MSFFISVGCWPGVSLLYAVPAKTEGRLQGEEEEEEEEEEGDDGRQIVVGGIRKRKNQLGIDQSGKDRK
jgi:hypothetical protein